MKLLQIILLVIAACLPVICACTSSDIYNGSNGIVRYQQFNADDDKLSLELVLVQESHEDCESILSERGEDTFIKKAAPDTWHFLVETLVDECCFLEIIESPHPRSMTSSPRVISVENEYGKWTSQSEDCIGECDGGEQDNYFTDMVKAFRDCFDNTFDLQFVEDKDKDGVQFFKEEQERLEKIKKRDIR